MTSGSVVAAPGRARWQIHLHLLAHPDALSRALKPMRSRDAHRVPVEVRLTGRQLGFTGFDLAAVEN